MSDEVFSNSWYSLWERAIIYPNECSGDEIEREMLQDHLDKWMWVLSCGMSREGLSLWSRSTSGAHQGIMLLSAMLISSVSG